MLEHKITYRIPYPEVDRLNVLHHGHYAKYYEMGRLELFRSIGWSYRDMEDEGIGLFVAELTSKFLKPLRYDDLITIHSTLSEPPGRMIFFETEIYNSSNEICNVGKTKLLFVSKRSMKVCSPPERLSKLVEVYFQKE